MGRLKQIEGRDAFATMTTSRHQDSFTSEDREWLIARVREAQVTARSVVDKAIPGSISRKEALDFLGKLGASDG